MWFTDKGFFGAEGAAEKILRNNGYFALHLLWGWVSSPKLFRPLPSMLNQEKKFYEEKFSISRLLSWNRFCLEIRFGPCSIFLDQNHKNVISKSLGESYYGRFELSWSSVAWTMCKRHFSIFSTFARFFSLKNHVFGHIWIFLDQNWNYNFSIVQRISAVHLSFISSF